MVVTTKKRSQQRKLKSPADWKLQDLPIDDCKMTAPEKLMATRFKCRYPSVYARLRRSNAPYKGTGYKSDFTVTVDHYHYIGIVIEVQGGIYSRHKSGHSSSTGLKRDYTKTTVAQLNQWFILQVAPDDGSLFAACEAVDEIIQRFNDENAENEALLAGYAGEDLVG
jgi:hypothetical protein